MKTMGAMHEEGSSSTIRQMMAELLATRWMTALELSQHLGIRAKEVSGHLEHLARTLATRGNRLEVRPPECLACGYVFRDRKKLTSPGRCPKCRASHIQDAAFRILAPG